MGGSHCGSEASETGVLARGRAGRISVLASAMLLQTAQKSVVRPAGGCCSGDAGAGAARPMAAVADPANAAELRPEPAK
jgi:hypothetical protein